MDAWIWPDWVEIALGGLGVAWGLSIFARLKDRPARPGERFNAWGILVFGTALAVLGGLRWLGLLSLT
jgi:hypothetical protein